MPGDPRYRTADVPVAGGKLRVGIWEPGRPARSDEPAPTVLAVHGITASHRVWRTLAERLDDVRLVAPDLRGRGRSSALTGPPGLAQHADDMTAVLDFLGVPAAPVVGHSMGGFVAVLLAHRSPGRVASLVLVDGGLPLALPEGATRTDAASSALGPAAERLTMTFPDREAYRRFWRAHPAFVGAWTDAVTDYLDYDLVGDPPSLRAATTPAAMTGDAAELYGTEQHLAALARLPAPTVLLRAPRGLRNEDAGMYPQGWMQGWRQRIPALEVREVPDVNHYTVLFAAGGVAAVADAVRGATHPPDP